MIVACNHCGSEFKIFPSQIKYNRGKFCSLQCYYLNKIGTNIPQETRLKMSIAQKGITGRKRSKESREKQSATNKGLIISKETRLKISKANKGRIVSIETRIKLSESHMGGFWYGNVRYYQGPKYCEKWTPNLRERVRAFFNYQCVECGTPQINKKLAVHHVWYNKKLCCDDTPRSLVALCASCHHKTTIGDRKYWSEHFQEIIDNYYDGKCWFTIDEMKQFKNYT